MVNHREFNLPGPRDSLIRGDLRVPEEMTGRLPVLVFCHGFKGFKNWGSIPYICERLAVANFAVLSFNFSHNGVGEDLLTHSEPDRFKDNTYALEREDLRRVLSALESSELPYSDWLDAARLGLIGHSRGGASVICVGAEHPHVQAVVSYASISRFGVLSEEDQKEWRRTGVRFVLNSRTGQELPMGPGLLDELVNESDRIERAAKMMAKPMLIVHGTADAAVSETAAHDLHGWVKDSEILIVENADHVFGARHPFQGTTDHLEHVIERTVEFFNRKLR